MSKKVTVSLKLDADVKESMEQVCSELGLSMSEAFTVFAKKVGREKRIPFEVSVDPFYSEENMLKLRNSIVQMDTGSHQIHEINLDDK